MRMTITAGTLQAVEPDDLREEGEMSELRRLLASGDYEVDAELVAEALIHKLWLIRRVTRKLAAGEAGRSPSAPARGR